MADLPVMAEGIHYSALELPASDFLLNSWLP